MKKYISFGLIFLAKICFSQTTKKDTLEIEVNLRAHVLYDPNSNIQYRDNKIGYIIRPAKKDNNYSGIFIVNDDGYESFMRVLPYPKPDGKFPIALKRTERGFHKNYGKDSIEYKYYKDFKLNARWIRYYVDKKNIIDNKLIHNYLKNTKLHDNEYFLYILKEVISLKDN